MLGSLLPAVPDLKDVCQKLLDDKCVDNNGWKNSFSPSEDHDHAPKAFKKLEAIYNNIHAARSGSGQKTVQLTMTGDFAPLSSRCNTSRPDGSNICWALEVKKNDDEANQLDNFEKIIWSLHHIMWNDSHRRFTFGLTIEDTTTRLWYHDRGTLVCSTPFDANTNWRELIHVFLALGSASHADLGFDTTMRLISIDEERSPTYGIDVVDADGVTRTFETVSVLTNRSADCVYGRASRVWKVVELLHPGCRSDNFYALKDCWLQPDVRKEHTSLADLCSKLADDPRLKHFLTVVTACVVHASSFDKNGALVLKPDDTKDVLRRGQDFVYLKQISINAILGGRRETNKPKIEKVIPRSEIPESSGGISDPHLGNPAGFRKIPDPNSTSRCALTGLGAMHDVGYLHRDVSAGNILLVDRDGENVGVIIDFEYAINISEHHTPHDSKTGTPAFLPVEVARQSYTDMDNDLNEFLEEKHVKLPFRQNGFHDLESFWWVCIWFLSHKLPPPADQCSDDAFVASYDALFLSAAGRAEAWHASFYRRKHLDKLSFACIPLGDELHDFARKFLRLKQGAYSNLGEDLVDPEKLQEPVEKALTSLLGKIEYLRAVPEVTARTVLHNCLYDP
ncbi:hypothetical protein BDP27DRAFT_1422886 [Rhodocollybia butyracea]|uniref:Fungal-type protein kinase domain-containing protein n=1 Tax=Rhodocollybia butyracea TaxID=206335 RepID=A0A9P5PP63_9AGAR|nr:hypothetical protein BDP27DRAFT_1422886 [Rhodocollybia butyracea]